jgi:hypothetical protein
MIDLLGKWNLHDNKYSFYDLESLTLTEMTARLHGKMNELITDYNKFVENTNKINKDFRDGVIEDLETYETAMRQEFQDFIDVINLKVMEQDTKIDDAVKYMKTNLTANALAIVEQALANKDIAMSVTYDEETEALSFVYVNE